MVRKITNKKVILIQKKHPFVLDSDWNRIVT